MISYIVVFILGCLFHRHLPDLKFRLHALLKVTFLSKPHAPYNKFKEEVLGEIKKLKSKFPEHQETNSLRILEIGVGTGTNFQFYPEGCHLVVVDPNPHWVQYYNANRLKFPQIKSEEIIVAYGEHMDMVPDNSIDTVVITKVLCSVAKPNIKGILKQVLRVLAPGGKLFFVEHVKEWDSKQHGCRQVLQDVFTILRIWPICFSGCELNRDTLKEIEEAGFSKVEAYKKHAPICHPIYQLSGSHLLGTATK